MPEAEAVGGLRYYIDESLLGLGKILARARYDVVHPGHRDFPEVPVGTLDPDWMPIVARLGLVVLIRDKRIRKKPVELATFRGHKLRAFGLAGAKDLTNWGYLELVVRHWARIEGTVGARGAGPWFYALTEGGLAEVPLPEPRTV